MSVKAILESDESYGATLVLAALDATGTAECLNWDPDTLRIELEAAGGHITGPNVDKLMAMGLALTSNAFYTDVSAFIHVCNALSGEGADFDTFDPATVAEMAWAVTEVVLCDAPKGELPSLFSDEVIEYMRTQGWYEGFGELPAPLDFVKPSSAAAQKYQSAINLGPDVFAAVFDAQQQKKTEVMQLVKSNLVNLVQQIKQCGLKTFDPEVWNRYVTALGLGDTSAPAQDQGTR